jgi:CRISPR-associated protein Csm3
MKRMISCGRLTGTIHVHGLRIGGAAQSLDIGNQMDLAALRDPVSGQPYIPGSALKGSLRAMLERIEGKSSGRGEPCGCGDRDCKICVIFGAHKNPQPASAPTRIVVRDARLTPDAAKSFENARKEGAAFFEEKAENLVLRDSGVAKEPRWQERVWDASFALDILLHIYEGDNPQALMRYLRQGLGLIQETGFLGAGGSRGSGQVHFDVQESWLELERITV